MPSRWALELGDRLRFDDRVRAIGCALRLRRAGGDWTDPADGLRQLDRLCGAARVAPTEAGMVAVEDRIRPLADRLGAMDFDWPGLAGQRGRTRLDKGLVLKAPGPDGERGAIYVSFEDNALRLAAARDPARLAAEYDLMIAPSWSPPHNSFCWLFPRRWPEPALFGSSNPDDPAIYARISPRIQPIDLYASSWVAPETFHPIDWSQKDYDIVMVANFGRFKRHWLLFRAMAAMKPVPRVLLLGQPQDGRTGDDVMREARAYGVAGRLDILSHQRHGDVARMMARGKISLVFSRREGSCVVVTESMFAGTPVGLLRGAAIGSSVFIAPESGRFLDEDRLPEQLTAFLAEARQLRPREWIEQRTGSALSTRLLSDTLRARAAAEGRPWTRDLAPMARRPMPRIVGDADLAGLASAYARLVDEQGLSIGDPSAYGLTN